MKSTPQYPLKELFIDKVRVVIPHIKRKTLYTEGEDYELTQEDIYTDKANIYANLAFKFYGDPSLWTILQDNNPPISDFNLDVGMTIFIPNIN